MAVGTTSMPTGSVDIYSTQKQELAKKKRRVQDKIPKRYVAELFEGKALVYQAEGGQPSIDWNCKIWEKGDPRGECRQLAYYVAKQKFQGCLETCANRETLKEVPDLEQNVFDKEKLSSNFSECTIFPLKKLGNVLQQQINKIKSEAFYMLYSENHAMALGILKKQHPIIKFYDPNRTATYKRYVCCHPDIVECFRAKHFLSPDSLAKYFPKFSYAILVPVSKKEGKVSQFLGTNQEAQLFHALRSDLGEQVGRLTQEILLLKILTNDEKKQVLLAKEYKDIPATFYTFYEGNTKTLKIFAQAILDSDLSDVAKREILTAELPDGTSGLFVAFEEGHTDLVKTFTEIVLNSDLSEEEKINILIAENSDGTPGFFMAFKQGDAKTVKAFTEVVLASKLSNAAKALLLMTKGSNGKTALCEAFKKGNTQAITAFTKTVLKSNLKESIKKKILRAERPDGQSGLSQASKKGNLAIESFSSIVLDSDLSKETKDCLVPPELRDL